MTGHRVLVATVVIAAGAATVVLWPDIAAWSEPSPTPATTTTPPAAPSELPPLPSPPGNSGGGIGGIVLGSMNAWFADLVALAINPLLDGLADTLLATPKVTTEGRLWDLWQYTAALANATFIAFVVGAAVLAMTHETVQSRYAIKEIAPRVVVAFIAANTSFLIAGTAIELANNVSHVLLGQGFDTRRAANAIRLMIVPSAAPQIFYVLLQLVAVILLVALLITFVLRVALIALLVVAAPLALTCHALPHTDGLARMWWRALGGLLLIQVAQSLTLVAAVRIFFNQDGREEIGLFKVGDQLQNLLLVLCLLFILVRIPSWVTRMVFTAGGRRSTVARIFKFALAYKLASPVLNALHLGRGRGGRVASAGRAAIAGKVAGAAAGPAGTAMSAVATAAAAACGKGGPLKHAPVAGRRPIRAADWAGAPIKHAPSAPSVQGKYRRTPPPASGPLPATTPVYGYPRDSYYAGGPAGLQQMYHLKHGQAPVPPRQPGGPAQPIVASSHPVPGTPDRPQSPGHRGHGQPDGPPRAVARRRKGGA